jgi:hypothetical protein
MDLERGMESEEEYYVTDREILNRLARMTAPVSAGVAQIYANGHAGNWVWMDSLVFRNVGGEPLNPQVHTPALDSTQSK